MTCAEAARKRWAGVDSDARVAHMRALAMLPRKGRRRWRKRVYRATVLLSGVKALELRVNALEGLLSGSDATGFNARLLERK